MDRDTVLCHCMDVSAGAIMDAVDGGAKTFDEVQEVTACGTGCGACRDEIEAFIEEYVSGKR